MEDDEIRKIRNWAKSNKQLFKEYYTRLATCSPVL